MTIQDFCVQYGYPLTTTTRAARRFVVAAAGFKTPPTPAQWKRRAVSVEVAGLRARKALARTRITYEVVDPAAFKAAVVKNVGYGQLLTDGNLALLIEAARFAHTDLTRTGVNESHRKWFESLGHLLRRVGAI